VHRQARLWGLCGQLVSAGKETPSAEKRVEQLRCAQRALDALRRAAAGGYHDAARLRSEPDLSLLHEREDFQGLLAEVERAPAPDSK
jgi:hypothetical protein